jgi:GT2 family glycosyltransferase
MNKFTFVILHYLTEKDTIECVDSIINNVKYENFDIVVVDNGSKNNSGKNLVKRYNSNKKIKIIINPENLGFAQGHNVGYEYAKYRLNSDFIALLNNDTFIEQSDFIRSLIDKFDSTPYHILGPDIISLRDGRHHNPCPATLQNINNLKKYLINHKISLFLNYLFLDKILEKIKKSIIKKPLFLPQQLPMNDRLQKEQLNVQLHASCLVFSPIYINSYDGLYSKTFLYTEEAILYFIAKRDALTTLYFPKIQIYHKEDSATNYTYKSDYKKRRFYLKNFIHSGKMLLDLMKETNHMADSN